MTPLVRVVVLNYDGGELVLACLDSLARLDWPPDRLDVVVVDNASRDGSPAAIRERFPDIRLLETGRNLGFAAGNNVALRDLADVDYVALLNNDAWVEPSWLRELVATLEADPGLGAACPKILFAPRFAELELETEAFVPGRGDLRELGVRVSGVRVDGRERTADAQFGEGFHGPERGGAEEADFRWCGRRGTLRVPLGRAGGVELRLAAEREKELLSRSGTEARVRVGPVPAWAPVPSGGPAVDVVQNAGSILVAGGYAGDRGYLEVDRGQFDDPAEVFAWCGCSVLLRRRYLEAVGLLDERLFLYYEDIDLSWRGRAQGWRYRYVPTAVARHVHAASSVEGSDLFEHYVTRNRLLVHVKNAPADYALEAVRNFLLPVARYAGRDVVAPLLRRRRPRGGFLRRRLRAFLAFLRLLPAVLFERRRLRRRQVVSDDELLRWVVRR